MFDSMPAAIDYIFRTRRRIAVRGLDEHSRDVGLTRRLLSAAGLPAQPREYAVVTGSRGKGSTASIMAKLLQNFGWRTAMMTSPHLVHWNERIRIDGAMIPSADFLRILSTLQPQIDAVCAGLPAERYLSPQGIFLAIALRWFDEQGVTAAVLEVGRGGRFDDIAVVPNWLAVFTPMMHEHTALLGGTLERIAWHKAGIISAGGQALSSRQPPPALAVLQREAEGQAAGFHALEAAEMAQWRRDEPQGQRIHLPRYGELTLPLLGRYQIENASLAVRAVELLQARLTGRGASAADVQTMRAGLAQVSWLGRVQKLQDRPAVYVDGAIAPRSVDSFLASVKPRLRAPVAAIAGTPRDRDYAAVYARLAAVSDALIITKSDVNPNTHFPSEAAARRAAQGLDAELHYAADLPLALEIARRKVGRDGTILLAVSLMLVGECMLLWQLDTAQI